jgi:glucose/arabinose dehydrogenase
MQLKRPHALTTAFALAPFLALPAVAQAATVANPLCPTETALFNPDSGSDIVAPAGFKVSVFKSGLNFPTGIAFKGNSQSFEVYVLESGHGLPSVCNDQSNPIVGGDFSPTNPFTPDILVFNQNGGAPIRKLGKPTAPGVGFQPEGPAVDIAFVRGFEGGRLFATDSNQSTHTAGAGNNSSRIVTVDPTTGAVTPQITGLPTGDHPTEQLAFKGGWLYWSQGSTTNSGLVGPGGQADIPCQDITLSQNVFLSSVSPLVETSGYSLFGTTNKGGTIQAFFNANTGKVRTGVCDGAILRARLNDLNNTIEPFSWGYRNGYAIRFAPDNHALSGGLLVGEDGADERSARPSNFVPDSLQLAKQNADGTPDYHGWPDRNGFLPSSQAVFNPIGGPGDDLCVPDPSNPPSMCTPASLANILKFDVPIADVLDHPPQPITSPLAIEAADSSFTGIDFVPNAFVTGPVQPGAALYSLEGDFGFSAANATDPAPEVGHEVKLINFNQLPGTPLALEIQRFAHNKEFEQSFVSGSAGFNRPTNIKFGPDGCAYVVDYGVVRDFGQSDPLAKFITPGDGPLVQIPGTGVIWKICAE